MRVIMFDIDTLRADHMAVSYTHLYTDRRV